ncbi:hypothetical protein CUS_7526 [Ruminococcus albus 8]|uniref:Uncharacterized protein n=1 Tax=Ruminococcus albus 8 TaxID=246199 RepID=E9SGZ8_RUMAL|nr:hypothetical protein CUS_7526 [Ruminococcus albus 8]
MEKDRILRTMSDLFLIIQNDIRSSLIPTEDAFVCGRVSDFYAV